MFAILLLMYLPYFPVKHYVKGLRPDLNHTYGKGRMQRNLAVTYLTIAPACIVVFCMPFVILAYTQSDWRSWAIVTANFALMLPFFLDSCCKARKKSVYLTSAFTMVVLAVLLYSSGIL